jgi:hypothetical protein
MRMNLPISYVPAHEMSTKRKGNATNSAPLFAIGLYDLTKEVYVVWVKRMKNDTKQEQ